MKEILDNLMKLLFGPKTGNVSRTELILIYGFFGLVYALGIVITFA